MTKTKATIRLEEDEAYVVAPKWFWNDMIQTYIDLERNADNVDHAAYWRDIKTHIQEWVNETSVEGEDHEEI